MGKRKRDEKKEAKTHKITFSQKSSLKCSLSTCLKDNRFKGPIIHMVHTISRLRVLTSLIWKHHVLQSYAQHITLPEISQSYLTAIKTLYLGGQTKTHYEGLEYSVLYVKNLFGPFNTLFKKSEMNQVFQYACRTMLTNWKVFHQEHAETSLHCWLNNRINYLLQDIELSKAQRLQVKKDLKKKEFHPIPFLLSQTQVLKTLHQSYHNRLQALNTFVLEEKEDLESEEAKVKLDHQRIMAFLLQLKTETEALPLSKDQIKQISVIPENTIQASYIKIDNEVLCYLYKHVFKDKRSKDKIKANIQAIWHQVFHMEKVNRMKKHHTLQHTVMTDGVATSWLFEKEVPKFQKLKRRKGQPSLQSFRLGEWKDSLLDPTLIKKWAQEGKHAFVGIDPGVCTLLACSDVSSGNSKCIQQKRYKYESGMNKMKRIRAGIEEREGKAFHQDMTNLMGAKKSSSVHRYEDYLKNLVVHWEKRWSIGLRRSLLKAKWRTQQKRQSFMDHVVDEVAGKSNVPLDQKPLLLFGEGGSSGFTKIKGGGVKGPIVELRKRLAKRTMLIKCSEFRTSKCCLECGGIMSHPFHAPRGVSFCKSKCSGKYRLESRDLLSSRCIAALFLARKGDYLLGSFSREVKVDDITSCREACHLSNALNELSAIGVMGLDN